MATSITKGTTLILPRQVLGYSSSRESGNLLHKIIGRADVDVSFKPAALRSGTLELLFDTHALALGAEAAHVLPGAFSLTDSDLPLLNMRYVLAPGSIVLDLDDATRQFWTVKVPFQEVI
jgi:hypothetical protein